MSEIVAVRRALLSVYDKSGLIDLARALTDSGAELLASGGTRTTLLDAGLSVTEIAEYTGQPEILGGRVKTLHPKIHAGILARRDVPADLTALAQQSFETIDLVVVNLYPFEATIARPGATFADAVENIDVGGPTLIRAASKNHEHVAVLTSPQQYPSLITAIRNQGGTTREFRRQLATAAFERSSHYDSVIAAYMKRVTDEAPGTGTNAAPPEFPQDLRLRFSLGIPLRYGENPHQRAAFYHEPDRHRTWPGHGEDASRQGTLV